MVAKAVAARRADEAGQGASVHDFPVCRGEGGGRRYTTLCRRTRRRCPRAWRARAAPGGCPRSRPPHEVDRRALEFGLAVRMLCGWVHLRNTSVAKILPLRSSAK